MIFLVDLGNSKLHWSTVDGLSSGQASAQAYRDCGIEQVMDRYWRLLPVPERVIVCSVSAAAIVQSLRNWVLTSWEVQIEVVSAQAQAYGVTNGYSSPDKLGADRWASLVAARKNQSMPMCIVDCGTAVTVDLLRQDGLHLGGVIAPGLGLQQKCLSEHAGLEPTALDFGSPWPATETRQAISAGVTQGTVGLIERLVAKSCDLFGYRPDCLISGGDGQGIRNLLSGCWRYEPDLVLKGLAIMAKDPA